MLYRVGKSAVLAMIALAWIGVGILIVLEECDVSSSFAAAWRAPTLTVFWIVLGGITLCIVTMVATMAVPSSKPKATAIPERETPANR